MSFLVDLMNPWVLMKVKQQIQSLLKRNKNQMSKFLMTEFQTMFSLSQNNKHWLCFRTDSSNSEKRPLEKESDDSNESEENRKKQRTDDEPKVTESILDDIRLEDIESRITVHVLDSPESCTHEVAVYPGNENK